MRNIRFDIDEIKVDKGEAHYTDKTRVVAICRAITFVNVGDKEKEVATWEIRANVDSSYGSSVIKNELHEVEFGYMTIFVNLFLRIISNMKLPEGGLDFHYKNFTWMSELHNESYCTWYEASKMKLL